MSDYSQPGIYHGVSWADYQAIDAMNPSALKHGCRSMLRLWRALKGECEPESPNVAVGNAVHCLIAGELEDRYAVMPAFEKDEANVTANGKASTSKATTYFKESASAWRETNDKEELNEVQVATASKIATRIRQRCGQVIDGSSQEVVVTGTIGGVAMKTRLDGLKESEGLVWDIKTTPDISDTAFYRVYKKMNYAFAGAVHLELLRQNGILVREYLLLAAENTGDYDCRIIHVQLMAMESKFDLVDRVIADYRKALDSGEWPGLPDAPLLIPAWDMEEEPELNWTR
jgi:hypothetical protein